MIRSLHPKSKDIHHLDKERVVAKGSPHPMSNLGRVVGLKNYLYQGNKYNQHLQSFYQVYYSKFAPIHRQKYLYTIEPYLIRSLLKLYYFLI